MPPKPKFTRQEIIDAALEFVSEYGIEKLTSRELGAYMNSSARPIFTVYRNMEELELEIRLEALRKFEKATEKAMGENPSFKEIGKQMITFAINEPNLFRLFYTQPKSSAGDFNAIFPSLGEMAPMSLSLIKKDYSLNDEQAKWLFQHVWIHTFGISVLCASRVCAFSEDEIDKMLTQHFIALIMLIKSGKADLSSLGYGTDEKN